MTDQLQTLLYIETQTDGQTDIPIFDLHRLEHQSLYPHGVLDSHRHSN